MPTPTTQLLAGDFPPGLNTAAPETDLTPGETPDSYGFDLTVDGKIKTGTVPTGTSRVQKTTTISTIPYLWHGKRLWNITNLTASTTSNLLTLGALNYDDVFFPPATIPQRIPFTEDAQPILAILPIEPDALMITKSTGSYVIRNISDTRGFFQTSDIIQELACGAANRAIVIGNVVYVGNATDGIQSYENFKTNEVSRKIRPTRATVGALAMTADYERKWLILGSTYLYDIAADKWFKYSGSSFRYTTRRVRNPDWSPFSVERLDFTIEHGDETTGILKYQLRHEGDDWSSQTYEVRLPYQSRKYTVVTELLEDHHASNKWQMRITSLSSGKYIRDIRMDTIGYDTGDYKE